MKKVARPSPIPKCPVDTFLEKIHKIKYPSTLRPKFYCCDMWAIRPYRIQVKEYLDKFYTGMVDEEPLKNLGYTPLHDATIKGKLTEIKNLIRNMTGIDVTKTKNYLGNTPIHLAAQNCKLEIIKYFMENVT